MTIFRNLTTLAASAVFMAGVAQGALADNQNSEVQTFAPNDLVVVNNGTTYTKLQNTGNAAMGVHLWYDAGSSGRVKSWTAKPEIRSSVGSKAEIPGMSIFKKTQSYGIGNRPKVLDTNIFLNFPVTALEQAAIGMCNDVAKGLKAKGQTAQQVFAADHKVNFIASVKFEVDASGLGVSVVESDDGGFPVAVTCRKWTGPAVPAAGTLAAPVEVKKATMKLVPLTAPGSGCKVKLTTAISTNKPNATIKYRYVHSSGAKSNVFSVKTAANMIAVVNKVWDIPNAAGGESGWMQMEGVGTSFESNRAGYKMSCKAPVGGFKANTGQRPLRRAN